MVKKSQEQKLCEPACLPTEQQVDMNSVIDGFEKAKNSCYE